MKPIHSVRDPVHIFGFGEIIPALCRTSRGKNTGKIVVSHWGQENVQLSIKPAMRRLRLVPNASHLTVGSLKVPAGAS